MLAVQDGIRARDQERRPLRDEREQVEEAIPEPDHPEHAMCAVAVQEERLREDRQRPVGNEEDKYRGHIHFPSGSSSWVSAWFSVVAYAAECGGGAFGAKSRLPAGAGALPHTGPPPRGRP